VPVQRWTLLGVARHRRRKGPKPIQQRESNVRCQPRQGRRKSKLPGQFAGVTHSHGPSWVDGQSQGQCAGFSTTTTSIAPATPTPCANLATLPASGFPVPNTIITEAVDVPAGRIAEGVPEVCAVGGYVNRHIGPLEQCQTGRILLLRCIASGKSRLLRCRSR
jgi:hypothetical protein